MAPHQNGSCVAFSSSIPVSLLRRYHHNICVRRRVVTFSSSSQTTTMLASTVDASNDPPLPVLVTGATGRTGRLVMRRLCAQPDRFAPRGFVRDVSAARDLLRAEGVPDDVPLFQGDVSDIESLRRAMMSSDPDQKTGAPGLPLHALVVLTSAVPKIDPASVKDGMPPSMFYESGGEPELVDWLGGKNQIDVAKEHSVNHVVLVGSMGSTNPNHPLNRIGNGNILKFKRQAEVYLIESGIEYTIINPGGLVNDEPGQREMMVSRNDEFFKIYPNNLSIPRADVAEVVVQALLNDKARNKAFDLACKPKGEGHPGRDFDALFAATAPGL